MINVNLYLVFGLVAITNEALEKVVWRWVINIPTIICELFSIRQQLKHGDCAKLRDYVAQI
jgi:hypothetical protein